MSRQTFANIDRLDELVSRLWVLKAAIEGAAIDLGGSDTLDHIADFSGFVAMEVRAVSRAMSEQVRAMNGVDQ